MRLVDTRPPFAGLANLSEGALASLPTPCYLLDEAQLRRNGEILLGVQQRTGCKILLAQKAFSNFDLYPLLAPYLAGTEASGLYESRLGKEELPEKENHVFCAAYRVDEFNELLDYADHIVFNSPAQLAKFGPAAKAAGKSVGLRINPERSTQEGHAIYDPCAPGSRLGTTRAQWDAALAKQPGLAALLDGLHFHTLCEQDADALAVTLDAVEEKFGDLLPGLKWLNFGGGHHITRPGYDLATLEACIARMQEKYGVQVYLEPGEEMSMDEMLKSVVVSSANDCATALAEHVAGSESAFVGMMNQRAQELGLLDTNFVNCTGLDDAPEAAEHLTTAHDIAVISRELLKHDRIRDYTTIWMDTVRGGKFGLSNTNKLVRFYQGTTGLKTGYTSAAGHCLAASAKRDGIELIAVVLHCASSADRFSSVKALLDYGFANYALVSTEMPEPLQPVPVTLGQKAAVQPELQQAAPILIEKGLQAAVTRTVTLAERVEAPVAAGQQLGTLTISANGETLAEIPIIAPEAIERLTWWELTCRLLRRLCMTMPEE